VIRRYGQQGFWEGQASGAAIFTTTYGDPKKEAPLPGVGQYGMYQYSDNSIVFGAILARISLFSQASFAFQDLTDKHLWGASQTDGRRQTALRTLENPWPNGTTGELLARMIQDVDLAGNAYIWDTGDQLVRLRPDQVTIVSKEVDVAGRSYREVVGYWWDPNPSNPAPSDDAQYYTVDEIAHWSPIPDPMARFRGMSWLTPVLREITADTALTDYKLKYLSNAATPNLLIKYKQKILGPKMEELKAQIAAKYTGVNRAFGTLILDEGADPTVVGNSLEQMNFTTVQAAGENRILIASGVPGIVVGSKEGLMAATYSNYAQAMRRFSDITMVPLWQSVCACLSRFATPPAGSRLWYDTSAIPALRQGEKEQADTILVLSQAMAALVRFGYEPDSVAIYAKSGDTADLKHSGTAIDITTEVPKAAPLPIHLAPPPASANDTSGDTSVGI
jgi:phage portal protein BeeE